MQKRLILDTALLNITLERLCQQLIENHKDFSNSVLLGLQPRGVFPAERIAAKLIQVLNKEILLGYLDTTFYRDDFRQRDSPKKANETNIDFIIEDKEVILVDDVLFTGRSTRAALDAMIAFGRPKKVELLVLVNRKYSRHLPIEPNYIGKSVDSISSQHIEVEWKEQGFESDKIWLTDKSL